MLANKLFLLLALSSLLLFTVYSQDEDLEIVEEPEDTEFMHQQQQMAARQQQFSMKRTACLVLSRYHSNTQKQMLQSIIKSLAPEDQNKYINKVYATAVQHCLPLIAIEEAQQFFVENPNFNPAQLFHIFDGFDYGQAANNFDHLTAEQKAIIKFIKQFDEEMAVKKEEREAQEQDEGVSEEEELSIFWIPIHGWGTPAQIVYMIIFLGIVGVALYMGFSNLNNSQLPHNKKKKKAKKV